MGGPPERGRTVQVPGPGWRKWLSGSAPEGTVRGSGTSRYRRNEGPHPGKIQVVPRFCNRPESVGLGAFFNGGICCGV